MKRVLVDITAAYEYAKKQAEEMAKEAIQRDVARYNSTHKRKIDLNTEKFLCGFKSEDSLVFSFSCEDLKHRVQSCGNFTVSIADFIVTEEADK